MMRGARVELACGRRGRHRLTHVGTVLELDGRGKWATVELDSGPVVQVKASRLTVLPDAQADADAWAEELEARLRAAREADQAAFNIAGLPWYALDRENSPTETRDTDSVIV